MASDRMHRFGTGNDGGLAGNQGPSKFRGILAASGAEP